MENRTSKKWMCHEGFRTRLATVLRGKALFSSD